MKSSSILPTNLAPRQWLSDLLFRFGLRVGVKVKPPRGLILCKSKWKGSVREYTLWLNPDNELTEWLDHCEGPWSMRMELPLHFRRSYLAFSRDADALMFRFLCG